MAAKRVFLETGSDPDQPQDGRRTPRNRRSFASVIGEVVMVNSLHNFCSALEPLLRRVVNEEVEGGLRRSTGTHISRSPSLRIRPPPPAEPAATLKLVFGNAPSLPVFTGSKILDAQNKPLRILLVDAGAHLPVTLPFPLKVDIVALYGDFSPAGGGGGGWGREEFERSVVREREGKRPLIAGDVSPTVRDGVAAVGEIEFTDNSSWIRSRKFRIGARVAPAARPERCGGVRILEAFTQAFMVKDHRGELYKKHHPPKLQDEVWRLEKIGKDGAFHRKLTSAEIRTVQDFLKLSVVDSSRLREILGNSMPDKMWEVMITHAQTCILDNKFYKFHGPYYTVVVNSICQVVKATINGQLYSYRDLRSINKAQVEKFAQEAYANWNSLEEIERLSNETQLLTQGTTRGGNYHAMANNFLPSGCGTSDSAEVEGVTDVQTWSASIGYDILD